MRRSTTAFHRTGMALALVLTALMATDTSSQIFPGAQAKGLKGTAKVLAKSLSALADKYPGTQAAARAEQLIPVVETD